jgi:para-nitrobenzyl esterase
MSGGEVTVAGGRLSVPPADAKGVRAFKGIPFAAPPVGPLRWKPPAAAPAWEGVRRTDRFGMNAAQGVVFGDIDPTMPGTSEDCLYLNVWSSGSVGDRLPVLFWIHGGGFMVGHGAEPRYAGANLAARGMVVVTANHRLSALGFMAHPELTAESPHRASGNYGLFDQLAALKWVVENIASFGGDPAAITIAGESAGSISVSALMASPLARGLFHRAIGQSGGLFPPPVIGYDEGREAAETLGVSFAKAVGAASLAELRAVPAERIVEAQKDFRFWPIADGYLLSRAPAEIFSAGEQNDVPLLAGWNRDEGFNFDLRPGPSESYDAIVRRRVGEHADAVLAHYPAATPENSARELGGDLTINYGTWAWLEAQRKTGKADVFRYRFDHAPKVPADWFGGRPVEEAGAFHAAEIVYSLDNLGALPWAIEDADRSTAAAMVGYWANFIRTGNPNGPGLPAWPSYRASGDPVMHIAATPGVAPGDGRGRFQALAG